jgi:hypothetical protein
MSYSFKLHLPRAKSSLRGNRNINRKKKGEYRDDFVKCRNALVTSYSCMQRPERHSRTFNLALASDEVQPSNPCSRMRLLSRPSRNPPAPRWYDLPRTARSQELIADADVSEDWRDKMGIQARESRGAVAVEAEWLCPWTCGYQSAGPSRGTPERRNKLASATDNRSAENRPEWARR